jgi:hypothetical protein
MALRAGIRPVVAVLVVTVCAGSETRAQGPKVEDLVAKASIYVHEFVDKFSNVVAEETYEQEISVPRRKRVLTGDFLLVRSPGDDMWQGLRDVTAVDGKPVGDREVRILRLFTEPNSNPMGRARELATVSSRHNLIDIGSLSNPLVAMAFLQRQYNDRFRFNLAGLDKKLGPDVRQVRFVESRQPTLLKGNSNSDVPSRGLYWIEEGTGRVVKTELQLGSTGFPIRIVTTYKFDEELGINVPATMEDWYPIRDGEFRGKATYGKFRRFQVQVSETPVLPRQ